MKREDGKSTSTSVKVMAGVLALLMLAGTVFTVIYSIIN